MRLKRLLALLPLLGIVACSNPGIYHQHFMTGGQIVHISDQPIAVKSVTINMETQQNDGK
jgi:hypothetical protein